MYGPIKRNYPSEGEAGWELLRLRQSVLCEGQDRVFRIIDH